MANAPISTITNSAGNVLASATIAAGGNTSATQDYSAQFEGIVQLSVNFATVAATAGVQVDVFARVGSGPAIDTIAVLTRIMPATASTTKLMSIRLPTGRYTIKLTNLDATNSVTSVSLTSDTINAVG